MTRFKPWTSGDGSNRSTNWATTTAKRYRFQANSGSVLISKQTKAENDHDEVTEKFLKTALEEKVKKLCLKFNNFANIKLYVRDVFHSTCWDNG